MRITIKAARDIGKAHDCLGVVVVGILGSQFEVITWGRSRFLCESLKGVGEAVCSMIETGEIEIHHETEISGLEGLPHGR